MNQISQNEIKIQRDKLIKYIRINGYRLIFGIGSFLIGSAIFFAWLGDRYNVTMIISAMIFVFIVLFLAIILSISLVEMYVLKVKRYSDNQVFSTYETLKNIELNRKKKK